ncbi:MAG: endonuclease/exonuclease/phosphatase family protein [Planctomycetaceae bacterium]|nr:endonuclease/exonuclease/phosphatase family protein [Planctomycetaceae bacterium]
MSKFTKLLLFVGALAGGGYYLKSNNFQLPNLPALESLGVGPAGGTSSSGSLPPMAAGSAVRIGSFNIQVFGSSKLAKREVVEVLVQIVRQFDIVAVQEVRASDTTVVSQFVQQLNATGRHYDAVVGPRLGRTNSKEQYAFIFDRERIEVDPSSVYTVADPDDLLHREPLVAGFRVRGVPPEEAFTFTLINIHTDPDETVQELDALGDVFRAVRNDGRHEDDIILLGDLNVDDAHLGELGRVSDITWVISGTPTNTRRTKQYDNLLFQRRATVEYQGRAGVFDFASEYQLSMEAALQVSDHMPVWAEFSPYEGGESGRMAARPR